MVQQIDDKMESAREGDRELSALYPVMAIIVSVLALSFLERELRDTSTVWPTAAVETAASKTQRFERAPVAPVVAARNDAGSTNAGIPRPRPRPNLATSSGS